MTDTSPVRRYGAGANTEIVTLWDTARVEGSMKRLQKSSGTGFYPQQ